MKKRILAALCVIALLVSTIPVGITAETGSSDNFSVGYAKTGINPWVDAEDPSQGVLPIPLAGYGDAANRLAVGIINDDGDLTDANGDEGLWATCVAVTDHRGKTVLFVSYDLFATESDFTNQVRDAIQSKVEAELVDCQLDAANIYISSSQNYNAPDLVTSDGQLTVSLVNVYGVERAQEILAMRAEYRTALVEKLAAMALEALNERKVVSAVNKSEIDASAATGVLMNANRHYINQGYKTTNSEEKTGLWFSGDNFGGAAGSIDLYEPTQSFPNVRGSYGTMAGNYVQYKAPVTDVNSVLYLLEFQIDGADPIVLANWRCPASMNSEVHNANEQANNLILNDPAAYQTASGYNCVSGGYINAFRCLMSQDYRVSFIQGADGNVAHEDQANYSVFDGVDEDSDGNLWDEANHIADYAYNDGAPITTAKGEEVMKDNGSWIRQMRYGILTIGEDGREVTTDENPGNVYGELLSYAAKKALADDYAGKTACDATGLIQTKQVQFEVGPNDLNLGEYSPEKAENILTAIENSKAANEAMSGGIRFPWRDEATGIVFNSELHRSNLQKWVNGRGVVDKVVNDTMELNTIALGDNVAFVTAPGDLYDYYNRSGSRLTEQNEWLKLNEFGYGTPFVMGSTNGYFDYIPNTLSYDYNNEASLLALGNTPEVAAEYAANRFAPGAYGANWTVLARGTGEDILDQFELMLLEVSADVRVAECAHCGEQTWTKLTGETFSQLLSTGNGGHFYLGEDISLASRVDINNNMVCLDLHGQTVRATGTRAFTVNDKLNVMDSLTGGAIVGNFTSDTSDGGAIYIRGTMNLYSGQIRAGRQVVNGGTIYVESGSLNLLGGAVKAGLADVGSCVYVADGANVKLAGNAEAADIYFAGSSADTLAVEGVYTGAAQLTLQNYTDKDDVGNALTAADVSDADLTVAEPGWAVVVEGSDLQLQRVIAKIDHTYYTDIADAIEDYAGVEIDLLHACSQDVVIPAEKTVVIDLNGFDITSTITANNTLYVKDSATDDYDVEDGKYGKLTGTIEGDVQGVALKEVDEKRTNEGYWEHIDVEENVRSYHKIYMRPKSVVIDPAEMGISYNYVFRGDQVVAENVQDYGVALSLKGTPQLDNGSFTDDCTLSALEDFQHGENGNTGGDNYTLVYGILKPTNSYVQNLANSKKDIFYRGYIQIGDTYLLQEESDEHIYNLREAAKILDTYIAENGCDISQVEAVIAMYTNFGSLMRHWDIPEIQKLASK